MILEKKKILHTHGTYQGRPKWITSQFVPHKHSLSDGRGFWEAETIHVMFFFFFTFPKLDENERSLTFRRLQETRELFVFLIALLVPVDEWGQGRRRFFMVAQFYGELRGHVFELSKTQRQLAELERWSSSWPDYKENEATFLCFLRHLRAKPGPSKAERLDSSGLGVQL